MTMYPIIRQALDQRPGLQKIYANLRKHGREADRLGDVPAALFDGLDVADLNRNGMAMADGKSAEPAEQAGHAVRKVADLCVVNEVFGHGDPALAIALPGGSLTLAVIDFASRAQKDRILARFDTDRPVWGAFAMTEPTSGTDATRMNTIATKVPGGYRLNGEKCFIGNAGRSAYVIVFATVAPEKGQFGIRPFFIAIPSEGLQIDDGERMLGLRAVRASRITLRDCFVADDDVIGAGTKLDPARSFAYAQASWNSMRPCLGSLIVGATQRVLDDLSDGLDDLDGYGAALRHGAAATLDEFAGRLYSARLLCRRAATLIDAGQPSLIASSIAKAYASDCARTCIERVMSLPGIGEHRSIADFSRWRRDFHAFNVMEGTGDIHRMMIARDRNRRRAELAPLTRDASEAVPASPAAPSVRQPGEPSLA
ncbi:acyl-CoA dehydrogenase [Paraburkholderia sp. D15]|uniref:acyl-CoA dehydrogenase family protein n=1 Tax=Paraburkholderia sp. D15 TaxID=2880218 RepID=UPI00247A7683|nr:acyl-CoA dehydrogenase family protein [Paraburkholderia sp. D15]WGS52285.1 acyl-CoA dehydrogenase [Paraburkholderia sp. D15]